MNTDRFSPRTSSRVLSFVMAALISFAMLGAVDHLATSAPPAGLVAQVTHAMAQG